MRRIVGERICILSTAVLLSTGALFFTAQIGRAAVVQVGVASPMVKVMIAGEQKGWPFEGVMGATSYSLSLARNEHEAFQVVLVPDVAVTDATVTISSIQPVGGSDAFDGSANVWLVGHVKGAAQPRTDLNITYPPYPLLTFKNSCTINANERVAFWVDIATTASTPPGDYTATVTASAEGALATDIQLNIHVWDIVLPVQSSLPTAFSIDNLWQLNPLYGSVSSEVYRK
jgi:hypothetical protein